MLADLRQKAALELVRMGWAHHQELVLNTLSVEAIERLLRMLDDGLKLAREGGFVALFQKRTDKAYDALELLSDELRREARAREAQREAEAAQVPYFARGAVAS